MHFGSFYTYWPSLKYSLRVLLNRLLYFTNSRLRWSKACLPVSPGMKAVTSFTASRSFLIALAISLKKSISYSFLLLIFVFYKKKKKTDLIVSRNVLRSVISSGILLNIRFNEVDFRLSSWNASSERDERYSITENKQDKFVINTKLFFLRYLK